MATSPLHMLTTLAPAPDGFTRVHLSKRHLLSGPVVVLVPDLATLGAVVPDYAARMQGIALTLGPGMQLAQISPVLWHVQLDITQVAVAAALAPGWLAAIAIADLATQKLFAVDTKAERTERQLQLTRHDYNDLTKRLLAQVHDLTAAKNALGELNQHLESRVKERTADLAQANTSLSKTLDDLRTTQIELVRTAQLAGLGSLVAGIAHELNTPIGTALTAATALAHEAHTIQTQFASGQLGRKALDQFLQNSTDISDLLERNLTRAAERIGHFKQVAVDGGSEERHRFQLADVVSGTLSFLAPKLQGTPYHLTMELDHRIEMDSYPGAISQVLSDFVGNALLHAFAGRDTGAMRLRTALRDEATLELTFSDDGKGIAADQLPHIFEPFYTTKFGQGGSGLGLYIVYTQVRDLLGGRVEVSSLEGQGTHFCVTVPLVAPRQRLR